MLHRTATLALVAIVTLATLGCGSRDRRAVPPHGTSYAVPVAVETLVVDAHAFGELARPLRADLERVAATDTPSGREALFDLALLDALDGAWPPAVARLDRLAASEPDPLTRVMKGLTIRIWADAIATDRDRPAAFRAALGRRLAALPMPLAASSLGELRDLATTLTPELSKALIREHAGNAAAHGRISRAQAGAVVFQRYAVVRLAPVAAIVDDVVGRALAPPASPAPPPMPTAPAAPR